MNFVKAISMPIALLAFLGCVDSNEVVIESQYPIAISISTADSTLAAIYHENLCDSYGPVLTNAVFNDRRYIVTKGWNFHTREGASGQANLVFIGNKMPEEPVDIYKIISAATEDQGQGEITVLPEIIIRYNGVPYKSLWLNRSTADFEYRDQNRRDRLSFSMPDSPPCLTGQKVLKFVYDYQGYLYNDYRTDSIYIAASAFEIHTTVERF